MTTTRELNYPCGTTIPAGSVVELVETFRVNRGRALRLRICWRGVHWQCEGEDVE